MLRMVLIVVPVANKSMVLAFVMRDITSMVMVFVRFVMRVFIVLAMA